MKFTMKFAMNRHKQIILIFLSWLMFVALAIPVVSYAFEDKTLGVHILSPGDLESARTLLKEGSMQDDWHFLTIPLTANDLNQLEMWQSFFKDCKRYKFIPIVRLATYHSEPGVWVRPSRYDIVKLFSFMNQLSWPTEQRFVIVFNEVNHAQEWGGRVDPLTYTQTLEFTTSWAKTEKASYVVMPAAMDLAASNGAQTMEAFTYLNKMLEYNPWIFDHVDVWNSHSYPNPAFSSSPERTTQNSLRGFEHELNFLKKKTGREFKVIITETGWAENRYTLPWLKSYYLYAFQHVWSHPQVIGVTPFLLRGAPGQFAQFSFFDEHNQPTKTFEAFRAGVKGVMDQASN